MAAVMTETINEFVERMRWVMRRTVAGAIHCGKRSRPRKREGAIETVRRAGKTDHDFRRRASIVTGW
jgi:hypothetical protein